ncbi:MAG: hypothetical protein IPO27_01850 [Bacteroidetes bacterium]|nr:hypothetical protein [Bacteroidota bacterium]
MAFIDRVMDVFFTIKGISLSLRLGSFLGFLSKPFAFFSNYLALTKFISKNNKRGVMNDFFVPIRRKGVRDEYYQYLLMQHKLNEQNITYLEFGVYKGSSMRWWVNQNKMEGSFLPDLIRLKDCLKRGGLMQKEV